MKRGQQLAIPAAGQQQLHHIFGAYDHCTNKVIWIDAESKNTASFIRFLEHFMASIDTSIPTVLLLDNASYHHSRDAEAALAFFEDDNLIPCWLPPYCSNLNPIERFWGHLKSIACANKLFTSTAELVSSARRCLDIQNTIGASERFLFLNT